MRVFWVSGWYVHVTKESSTTPWFVIIDFISHISQYMVLFSPDALSWILVAECSKIPFPISVPYNNFSPEHVIKSKETIDYTTWIWIRAPPVCGKVCDWIDLWIACLHSCVNTNTSHMKSSPGTGPVNVWCLQTCPFTLCVICPMLTFQPGHRLNEKQNSKCMINYSFKL